MKKTLMLTTLLLTLLAAAGFAKTDDVSVNPEHEVHWRDVVMVEFDGLADYYKANPRADLRLSVTPKGGKPIDIGLKPGDDLRDCSKELVDVIFPFPFPWIPDLPDIPEILVYDDASFGNNPAVVGEMDRIHIEIEIDWRNARIIIHIYFDKDMVASDDAAEWSEVKNLFR